MQEDYIERVGHMVPIEIVELRDQSKARGLRGNELVAAEGCELLRPLQARSRVVVFDETGTQFSSAEFAHWIQGELNRGTKEIAFVIGGQEGIDSAVLQRADLRLSLSKMTWTHEMCRVLALEQIYRAYCILRRIPYHRQVSGGGS